ncbi:hypothetical protein [Nonomuraea sp. NPDC050691]
MTASVATFTRSTPRGGSGSYTGKGGTGVTRRDADGGRSVSCS